MNLGSIPFIYQLLDFAKGDHMRNIRVIALTRGFIMAVFWSPYFVSMALVLSYFQLSWIELFPIGLIQSSISLMIAWFLFRYFEPKICPFEHQEGVIGVDVDENIHRKRIKEFITAGLVMVVSIFALEHLFQVSIIAVISIVSLFTPFICGAFLKKWFLLKKELNTYIDEIPSRLKVELLLFMSAGFFAQSIFLSNTGQFIAELFSKIGLFSPMGVSFFLVILTIILSVLGMHPIVIVGSLSAALSGSSYFTEMNHLLAFTLLSCWAISVISSPFSGLNLSVSGLSKLTPTYISFRMNWLYTLLVTISVLVLANVTHWLFWS